VVYYSYQYPVAYNTDSEFVICGWRSNRDTRGRLEHMKAILDRVLSGAVPLGGARLYPLLVDDFYERLAEKIGPTNGRSMSPSNLFGSDGRRGARRKVTLK